MLLSDLLALPVFPLADRFPFISDEDLLSLAESLEVDGQQVPVVIYEGQLLDGRNRLRAMQNHTNLTEVEVREFEGSWADAVFIVLASNAKRRHMNASQKAVLADDPDVIEACRIRAKAAQEAAAALTNSSLGRSHDETLTQKIVEASDQTRSDREARAMAVQAVGGGTNREYVRKASKLSDEQKQAVLNGETTVPDEYEKLPKQPKAQAPADPTKDRAKAWDKWIKKLDKASLDFSNAIADAPEGRETQAGSAVRAAIIELMGQTDRKFPKAGS